MEINVLTHKVIGCAYKVHNVLGPGFLEKVYENALKLELRKQGFNVRQQAKLPVCYEGHQVGIYYPDLWIDGQLIIEIKAGTTLAPEHEMKTYPLSHRHWHRERLANKLRRNSSN